MNEQDKAAFEAWFLGEQGKVYDGVYTFSEAAWTAALAYAESKGKDVEPVAWISFVDGGLWGERSHEQDTPLYTRPQPIPEGWQPIETAPRDGTYILVSNGRGVWVARFKPVYQSGWKPASPWQSMMLNHDHIPSANRKVAPTIWMPLPAAPEAPK